jgi:hypothetical protein
MLPQPWTEAPTIPASTAPVTAPRARHRALPSAALGSPLGFRSTTWQLAAVGAPPHGLLT